MRVDLPAPSPPSKVMKRPFFVIGSLQIEEAVFARPPPEECLLWGRFFRRHFSFRFNRSGRSVCAFCNRDYFFILMMLDLLNTDKEIAFMERDKAHALRRTSHDAHILHVDAQGLSGIRHHDDAVFVGY